ncbi:sulfate ABC transporter substrate-binding protein [Gloeocapsopsis crepidinum LEGE 06123]|uniref:Sulfate ABC transporter substrate-binding protein n=1 Tax=Gloeocapsopsis crepidinum LEGE 06123 TaxID=588587 RepID=A0ABR9UUD8_9CHRO|nr:sulfate ABC transporter substrate-binding protein [Gloeocapsopsis crepidinum]MBE9191886.1 sulfate ABC transporter substrate-binding protein [Gloeocapsopsis crepidinum LEGE 06123]
MGLLQIIPTLRASWKKFVSLFLVGVGLSVAIASCAPSSAQNRDVEITLVSYAVTKAAYKEIIPQFTAMWKQQHNQNVLFNESYGGSGAQTRAVVDGLDADVVALALALDMKKVEKAGLIQPGWEKEAPNNAIVHKSVAAIVTREGNPQGIQTWSDLTKNNVKVVTANPKTSGGARWNFLALWGAIKETGGSDTEALDFAREVYQNAPVLPRDAREASDVFFNQEEGDALVNYENEVLFAAQRGEKLPYVVPKVNISIDNPIAVVDRNVDRHGNREIAEAFVQFLFTPAAQREFAKVGFRPVDPTVEKEFANQFPKIETLFTVQDLGGWNTVQQQFFEDGAEFDKIQTSLAAAR